MMTTSDPRVTAYLRRLEAAAARLSPEGRAELVNQIRDHIDIRLAKLDDDAAEDPVELTLSRLGDPEEIAAAAGDEPPVRQPEQPELPAQPGPGAAPEPKRRQVWLEPAALVLLLFGGFAVGIGWVVGVILVWSSPLWTNGQKLLGTVIWPGGLVAPVAFGGVFAYGDSGSCASTVSATGTAVAECAAGGNQAGIVLFIVGIVAPLLVAAYLGIRAARRAAAIPDNAAS